MTFKSADTKRILLIYCLPPKSEEVGTYGKGNMKQDRNIEDEYIFLSFIKISIYTFKNQNLKV